MSVTATTSVFASEAEPARLGAYEILRQVGNGGMGVVYEAVHVENRNRVALKAMTRTDSTGLYRLKNEFRGLRDLVQPNLVRLHELGHDRGVWFVVMDFVEGQPFQTWSRPDGLDLQRMQSALRQLVAGLAAIHEVGKVHRDIKASNVLVDDAGKLTILDFGLLSDQGAGARGQTAEYRIAGTLSHLAPELVSGAEATAASDWYAVGVMLYEALVGRLPFEEEPGDLLAVAERGPPEPPSKFSGGVPYELEGLCLRMLAPVREQRPVLAEIVDILDVRLRAVAAAQVPSWHPLCGRTDELQRLLQAFDRARDQRACQTVFLTGASGIGKTAILDELVRQLPQVAFVLRGRCYERETIPLKALDNLIDELSRNLCQHDGKDVSPQLLEGLRPILRVFPVLARVPWLEPFTDDSLPAYPGNEMRRRAILGLAKLVNLASSGRPTVIIVDDLQWSDHDSAHFMRELLEALRESSTLAVLTHREEDLAASPLLPAFKDVSSHVALQVLRVGPLDGAQASLLAARCSRGRGLEDALVDRIVQASGGVPFLLVEISHQASDEDGAAQASANVGVDELVRKRLATLDERLASAVEVLCIAAHPLVRTVLGRASQAEHITDADLRELERQRFVRVRPDGKLETYHDRIRQAVVDAVPSERRRVHHRALARELQVHHSGTVLWVVEHWLAADEEALAVEQAVVAARRAQRALAFDRAAAFYEFALRGEQSKARRAILFRELAEVLISAGKLSAAADAFLESAESVDAPSALALRAHASQLLLLCGRLIEGQALLERIFPALGLRLPRTGWGAVASYLFSQLRISLCGLKLREVAAPDSRALLQADVCRAAGQALFVDRLRGAAIFSRGVLIALTTGDRSRVALALAGHAAAVAYRGPQAWPRVLKLLQRARAMTKGMDDPAIDVQLLEAEAGAALLCGAFDEAAAKHHLVMKRAREIAGLQWDVGNAAIIGCAALYITGATDGFADHATSAVHEALRLGHRYTATMLRGHAAYGRLLQDDPRGAREELDAIARDWPYDGFHGQHVGQFVGETALHLYEDRADEAWRRVCELWPALNGSLLMRAAYVRMDCECWRARAAVAALAKREDKSLRRTALRSIRKLSKSAFAEARSTARLLAASVHRASRPSEAAQHSFDAAETEFELLGRPAFAAAAAMSCRDERRRARALTWLKDHGVVDGVAFARMYGVTRLV